MRQTLVLVVDDTTVQALLRRAQGVVWQSEHVAWRDRDLAEAVAEVVGAMPVPAWRTRRVVAAVAYPIACTKMLHGVPPGLSLEDYRGMVAVRPHRFFVDRSQREIVSHVVRNEAGELSVAVFGDSVVQAIAAGCARVGRHLHRVVALPRDPTSPSAVEVVASVRLLPDTPTPLPYIERSDFQNDARISAVRAAVPAVVAALALCWAAFGPILQGRSEAIAAERSARALERQYAGRLDSLRRADAAEALASHDRRMLGRYASMTQALAAVSAKLPDDSRLLVFEMDTSHMLLSVDGPDPSTLLTRLDGLAGWSTPTIDGPVAASKDVDAANVRVQLQFRRDTRGR